MTERICWDASPLISARIRRKGIPAQLLRMCVRLKARLVASAETLEEVSVVLRRRHIVDRYHLSENRVRVYLRILRRRFEIAPGILRLEVIQSDPKDNHVLSAAVETGCIYLVSGGSHLLTLRTYGDVQIITPRSLLELLSSRQPAVNSELQG